MNDLFLSLGSNIVPRYNLTRAITLLRSRYQLLRASSWFFTLPWGVTLQPWFINCAIHIKTCDTEFQILDFTQSIENRLGRQRPFKNGPRTIDIDLLLYGDKIVNDRSLTLPHPGLTQRDFMLVPLLELAPLAWNPLNRSFLIDALPHVTWKQIANRVADSYYRYKNRSDNLSKF